MAARPDQGAFEAELGRALLPYRPASAYLIGVSGGRDSVALLHGLLDLNYRRLTVAHLDHGLRGRASRGDARFVQRLAAKSRLAFETARVDVAALARAQKLSLETAARAARYRFFGEVSARCRGRTLLLAHHADDQVETFLFNLLRGAGPAGLAAMRAESVQQFGRSKLRIVRPLLGVWRAQIDDYLTRRGLTWREDVSNADGAHTRNRLRAEILPLLTRAMERDVRPALWRTAEILGAEEEWLRAALADEPLPVRLPAANLRLQPIARQRRVLRQWLHARQLTGIGYEEVELVRGLLDPLLGPSKINLPNGRHVRRRGGVLFVE